MIYGTNTDLQGQAVESIYTRWHQFYLEISFFHASWTWYYTLSHGATVQAHTLLTTMNWREQALHLVGH